MKVRLLHSDTWGFGNNSLTLEKDDIIETCGEYTGFGNHEFFKFKYIVQGVEYERLVSKSKVEVVKKVKRYKI